MITKSGGPIKLVMVFSLMASALLGEAMGEPLSHSIRTQQASLHANPYWATKSPPTIVQRNAATGKLKFGVFIVETNATGANIMNRKEPQGVTVAGVVQDSIAFGAGLMKRDVILQYGTTMVHDVSDLHGALAKTAPGSVIPLTIWREGSGKLTITAQFPRWR